jgi:DNA-binding SARP family transcriptional activator
LGTDFRILGPLEVWAGGTRLALPSVRHQRLLAALLLSPNTVVPMPRLVSALWDEDPPTTATKQVQNCVSALRERLDGDGGVIVTDGPGYRAEVDEEQLDLLRFRRGVARARRLAEEDRLAEGVTRAREALELWRGPALDGIGTTSLAARAASLTEQRLTTVEQCVDWQLALGQHREVVDELTELVAEHPLRERMCAQLMLALDGGGRSADALMVFHQLRERLSTELGVDPCAEVRSSYEQVLRGTVETPTPDEPDKAPAEDKTAESELDRAVSTLATAIRRQWTIEAQMRSLNRPEPIRVNWSGTLRRVTVMTEGDARPYGDLADLVGGFRRMARRQMVVLGEPGAGKTVMAMLLTLGLLTDPEPDEPVPVLLSLSSWRPDQEHLHTWLARMLVAEYPGLANVTAYGRAAATRLVADGRIMPVLDGLDEMPAGSHAAAIDAIDRAAAGGGPIVVTCRAAEYERAVRSAGVMLAGATVVEIEPVELDAAITFLTAREPHGSTRWQPVIAHLREHPAGALAQALRTPLMVDLARTAYRDPATDPADLCDRTRFPDSATCQEHLLDQYLPAVYTHQPAPPDQHHGRVQRQYDPRQAERWLTFVARHLRQTRTHDLAWWRFDRALPRWLAGLLLGLPPAVLFAATGFAAGGLAVGLVYGLAFAIGGCLAHYVGQRQRPRRVVVKFRGTARRFLRRCGIGVVVGTVLGVGWSLPPGLVVLVATVFALGVGSHAWLDIPVDVNRVASPRGVLRADRIAALWFTVSFGLIFGVFYGMAFAFTKEIRYITFFYGWFDLVIALAAGLAATLLGRFLLGRVGSVAYGLSGTVVGGLVFPAASSVGLGLAVGAVFGFAIGLTVFLSRASGAFTVSRLWLAARGHLPLRLMTFLEDAHRRGVLRQVGAVYQFRHSRLADRLSGARRR